MTTSIFEPLELETIRFYRYLPQSIIEEKIERLGAKIDELEDKIYQLDAALDVCYNYMTGDFTRFIEALPWIIGATCRNEPTHIESTRDQIARHVNVEKLNLDSFYDCRTKLATCIKDTKSRIGILRENMGRLIEISEDGDQSLPIPKDFFVEREYTEGEPVIGYCEEADRRGYLHIGPLWAGVIENAMIDLWEMAVRPLTNEEYTEFGLEALRGRRTSQYLSYAWAISYETYKFYEEHPKAIGEHLAAFRVYTNREPKSLLALQEHFS